MRIVIMAAIALLSACSTGVVQMDKDSYMISDKAGGCGFASGAGQEADVFKKANKFCAAQGKKVETLSVTDKNGIVFARCASAELKFRCVP